MEHCKRHILNAVPQESGGREQKNIQKRVFAMCWSGEKKMVIYTAKYSPSGSKGIINYK